MRARERLAALSPGLLIALAPFVLGYILFAIASVLRPSKAEPGYMLGRELGTVVAVEEGGPAARAGILPGDRILAMNGVPMAHLDAIIRLTARARAGDALVHRVERAGKTFEVAVAVLPVSRETRLRRVSVAATGLAFLAVGLLVVLRRRDAMGLVFYSLTLVFAFLFAPPPALDSVSWNVGVKLLQSLCYLLLPALFLHFFVIFPYRVRAAREHPRIIPALYAPGLALFAVASVLDVLYLSGQRYELLSAIRVFGAVSEPLIVAGLLLGIASFVRSYLRTPPGVVRRRLTGVLWGTLLGILPLLIEAVARSVDPTLRLPGARYYHLSLLLVPLAFAYAIVRYGLMDLEIIIKRSVVYTILTALLAAIYLLVVEGIGRVVLAGRGDESLLLKIASIFVMAVVFSPVRARVQAFVDRTFYRETINYRDTLRDVSEEISGMIELGPLVERLARRIAEVLRVSGVAVFVRGRGPGAFTCEAAVGAAMASAGCYTFGASDQVLGWALEKRGVLSIERLQESVRWHRLPRAEKQALRQLGAALLLPLVAGEELVGLVVVGGKESGEPHSTEEIALLRTVAAQSAVAVENARLHQEAVARARIEEELALARTIQQNFLPEEPPSVPEVELAALNVPCEEVGGDYYDFLLLRGRTALGLAIGDASGKGIPAALLMASFQAAFHAEAESHPSPARVLERLNRLIIRQSRSERFVTFFYGLFDRESRTLTYANAGHNPPLLLRADGTRRTLDEAGLLLGVGPETRYQETRIPLEEGDLLLLYTDGVTDELSPADEIFGLERLEALLQDAALRPLSDLLPAIYRAVLEFMGGRPEDDITLLAMRVRGPAAFSPPAAS